MGMKREPWKKPIEVLPDNKWKIHLRDYVEVIGGPDKGQRGVVVKRLPKENRLIVKGANMKKVDEVVDGTRTGGKVMKEQSVHYSDVMLIDPTDDKRCRVKVTWTADFSRKVRVSCRTGVEIPRVAYKPTGKLGEMNFSDQTTLREDVLERTYDEPEWPTDPRIGIPKKSVRRRLAWQAKLRALQESASSTPSIEA